ncbi:MAG: SRPBCC family protein [Acetobacteraceae bacterium]|nr:SRPBCC family protein [Acetobacteraceae bacterium]
MASIYKEVLIEANPDALWAALRDVGNVHRLFPGVLTNARLEGDTRVVTFAGGQVARERIVALDDERRRVAYGVVRDGLVHHSASMQVFADGAGCSSFVWISDFLPDDLMAAIRPRVEQGAAAIKRAMEDQTRRSSG